MEDSETEKYNYQMKISLYRFNSWMDMTEEIISELEDKLIKSMQS